MKPRKSIKDLHNSPRRQKVNRNLIDRISDLPDSILTLILSSLPTREAVATSILSQRWKFLWTTVLNLDFCGNFWNFQGDVNMKFNENMKFVKFVNRVLRLHDDAGLLHKFRLDWGPFCIPVQVNSWITTAIARNVRQIDMDLRRYVEYFKTPTSVFSIGTLQSLALEGTMWVPASIVVSLPRLETLKLTSVYFKSEEALHKIMLGCPMLNFLHIDMIVDLYLDYSDEVDKSEFRYIISSTSLRHLELGVRYWDDPIPCRLELEASSLEYLKLRGFITQIFVRGSLSNLVEADFGILWFYYYEYTEDNYNSLVEVVRAFDCAKSLTLSTRVMWALSHATISLSTKFIRLMKLEAGAECCYCSSLEDFIQRSNNLEVLTIYQHSSVDSKNFVDEINHEHSNWTAPVEVPRCLSNSLRAVVFDGYSGSDDEREMIGYLLKHGSALEVMQISIDSDMHNRKFEFVQEICSFPRKSPACKVEFVTSRLYGSLPRELDRYFC